MGILRSPFLYHPHPKTEPDKHYLGLVWAFVLGRGWYSGGTLEAYDCCLRDNLGSIQGVEKGT